jgi:hypothetical protein
MEFESSVLRSARSVRVEINSSYASKGPTLSIVVCRPVIDNDPSSSQCHPAPMFMARVWLERVGQWWQLSCTTKYLVQLYVAY